MFSSYHPQHSKCVSILQNYVHYCVHVLHRGNAHQQKDIKNYVFVCWDFLIKEALSRLDPAYKNDNDDDVEDTVFDDVFLQIFGEILSDLMNRLCFVESKRNEMLAQHPIVVLCLAASTTSSFSQKHSNDKKMEFSKIFLSLTEESAKINNEIRIVSSFIHAIQNFKISS